MFPGAPALETYSLIGKSSRGLKLPQSQKRRCFQHAPALRIMLHLGNDKTENPELRFTVWEQELPNIETQPPTPRMHHTRASEWRSVLAAQKYVFRRGAVILSEHLV